MKQSNLLAKASVMLAFVFIHNVQAQVPVAESQSLSAQQQQAQLLEQQEEMLQANAQLFYQLQQLQTEVMQMRGSLEEQAHQIRTLKQQRLDDYVNLDKRIAELAQTQAPIAGNVNTAASPAENSDAASTVESAEPKITENNSAAYAEDADKTAYKAAYGLIKAKQFDEAKASFEQFSKNYPKSVYAPNAYYWLGELYILDANYEQASQAFGNLLDQFPDHRKYPEALYKQAKVNYELGKRDVAKAQLDEVIAKYEQSSSSTVRLAREFIRKHYP